MREQTTERLLAPLKTRKGSYFSKAHAWLGAGLSAILVAGTLAASFAFPATATNWDKPSGSGMCTVDNAVTTYVGGDFTDAAAAKEIEGITVVAGNATFDEPNFNDIGYIGNAGSGAKSEKDGRVLSVGGNLTIGSQDLRINATQSSDGGVVVGGAIIDPSNKLQAAKVDEGVGAAKAVGNLSPYKDYPQNFKDASDGYAGKTGTPATTVGSFKQFTGNGSSNPQVFTVGETQLDNVSNALNFQNIKSDATIVINVQGSNPRVGANSFYVNGAIVDSARWSEVGKLASRVVWNFPDANTVTLTGNAQFMGTIIVPQGSLSADIHLNGRVLVAGNLSLGGGTASSGYEIHSFPGPGFPCNPNPNPDPTPTPTPTTPTPTTPPATDGNAKIVVHKGGDRLSNGNVAGLEGATFAAYQGSSNSFPSPLPTAADTCTTDANGECSLDVTASSKGTGFWVVETSAPNPTWGVVGTLATGSASSSKFVTDYRYFVEVKKGNTANVPSGAQIKTKSGSKSSSIDMRKDSSGKWANVRDNGDFPKVCGVDIAIVFDVSNSVDDDELKDYKSAARAFVSNEGLGGTPSSVAMFKFATTASKISESRSLATADDVTAAINTINTKVTKPSNEQQGATNWDAALHLVANDRDTTYDLVLFLTDGDPTVFKTDGSGGNGSVVTVENLDNAIFSANELKSKTGPHGGNTMILPVGIGLVTNDSALNLKAISGENDYVLAGDFKKLKETLRQIATANCGGSVTVTKKIADDTGKIVDESASGWTFTGSGNGVTGGDKTTGDDGTVNYKVDFGSTPSGSRDVKIVETQQTGFELKKTSQHKNAICTDEDNNSVNVANDGALGFVVPVAPQKKINCVVVNQQLRPQWTIEKAADKTSVVPGESITYTLKAVNNSRTTAKDATATDRIIEGVEFTEAPAFGANSGLSYNAGSKTLTWNIGDIAANGGEATTSYTVKVKAGASGVVIKNKVEPGTNGDCLVVNGVAKCTTTTTTPDRWTLKKDSTPASGSTVQPGQTIEYKLIVKNESHRELTNIIVNDDLSQVLNNARPVGSWPAALKRSGNDLTWTIQKLAAGAETTVKYTVQVDAGAWGVTLYNAATPESPKGGECISAGGCTTTHETPVHWKLMKSSDHADGKVKPGETLTYTLRATNASAKVVSGATASDKLDDVLTHAALSEPLAPGLNIDKSSGVLSWNLPDIPVRGYVEVSYTVTVNADAWGVSLTNLVTPGTNGKCAPAEDCTTTHETPGHWTIKKESDPKSGSTVKPGDTIEYTLTAKNDSGKDVKGAVAIDDLNEVLAHATITHLDSGLSYDAATKKLTWTFDADKGKTATVSYKVKVNANEWGVSFANHVTATGEGICEPSTMPGAPADANCTTTHNTPGHWVIVKKSLPKDGSTVQPGSPIKYILEATNASKTTISGATAADELKDVLANATLTSHNSDLTPSGTTLAWALPTMAPGQTVTTEYTVTVDAGAWGAKLKNVVTPTTPEGHCVTKGDCTTTHVTPGHWTIKKSSDPASGSEVQPNDVVKYTLTVQNDSTATISGQTAVDDLSKVLNHAKLTQYDDTQMDLNGDKLTWNIPDVAPGAVATITYEVTVDKGAWGVTLKNVVTPKGDGVCVLSADCTTTHKTPGHWTIEKTSDPKSGTEVKPGKSITYTLKVHNDSVGTLKGQTAVDDLSQVLPYAQVTDLGPGLAYDPADPTKLIWSIPTIAADGDATVSYTVLVDSNAWGVTLKNHVTPNGDGKCVPAEDCITTNQTPDHWTLKKAAMGSNGTPVKPGDTVTYTLTAHNDSKRDLTGVTATDDVSGLIDHVAVETLGSGLAQTGATTLTWSIGDLAAGQTKTVSYTVLVNADAWGVTLKNLVTPGDGGHCVSKSDCTTTNETPDHWTLEKTSDPASGSTVEPGETIRYRLTASNLSDKPLRGATATDELKDVLANASITDYGTGLRAAGTTLIWTIPTIAPNSTVFVEYEVTVHEKAWGVTLKNVVTPGTNGECVSATSCTTEHKTPGHYTLVKTSDPASGSTVLPGAEVTYTLTAHNNSTTTVKGAKSTDNLTDVLDDATLEQPLDASLELKGDKLVWNLPTLAPGATASVNYTVIVKDDAWKANLVNVVTPGSNGECVATDDCTTDHHAPDVDLNIVKAHEAIKGDAVDSGKTDTITYTLQVSNNGKDAATGVKVTDELPAGLTLVTGSETLPSGDWSFTVTDRKITVESKDAFGPGATATITFTALVGELTRSGPDVPFSAIDNTACVSSTERDADMEDNCSTDTTKVKSVAVTAEAICELNAPYMRYSLTPHNVSDVKRIALIWWTQDGYTARDASIPADDEAALLADGAKHVDYIDVPADWKSGDPISGQQLWPGAKVDANGNGINWPGWRQLPNGQWVLDPASEGYDLRSSAVFEVRINPTTAYTTAYPPTVIGCAPAPITPLAFTGSDVSAPLTLGGLLAALGAVFLFLAARRRKLGGQPEKQ